MPKNFWLKIYCFLTGYEYAILKDCSQISKNDLKRISASLLIISLIWAFIGFFFCINYFQSTSYTALIGAVIMVTVVIQIEKQIILAINPTWKLKSLRVLLGLIIAIIGSVVIDQVIFKNDINIIRKDNIENDAKGRTKNEDSSFKIGNQRIADEISKQTNQKLALDAYINKHGAYIKTQTGSHHAIDTNGRTISTDITNASLINPKVSESSDLTKSINNLNERLAKESQAHNDKITGIEKGQLNENAGFLNEISTMVVLLNKSGVALIVYILWFCFFLFIELFILVTMDDKKENDYDRIILHQMTIREKRLKVLEDRTTNYLGEEDSANKSRNLVDQFPT